MSHTPDPRPHPPDPPDIPPDWEKSRRHLTARIKADGKGFDVRPMNFNEPQGKFRATDWPAELLFGPPSQTRTWPPLLQKWGVMIMGAAGFINGPNGSREDESVEGRIDFLHNDNPIHPLLREEMWEDLDPDGSEFEAMKPALRLATAILDDPTTLCLFAGLMIPTEQMRRRVSPRVGVYHVFEPLELKFANEQDVRDVYNQLLRLRHCMRWSLSCDEVIVEMREAYAITYPRGPGLRPGTTGSLIKIASGFVEAMQDIADPDTSARYAHNLFQAQINAGVTQEHLLLKIDPACAINRTMLYFAATILHELAHAIVKAFVPPIRVNDSNPANPLPQPVVYEPFFRDNRVNEAGYAVTSYIFGALFSPMKSISSEFATVPFGLYVDPDWTQVFDASEKWGTRALRDKDRRPRYVYPVFQCDVDRMFSKTLWEDDIEALGLSALHFDPQIEKWKVPHDYEQRLHRSTGG